MFGARPSQAARAAASKDTQNAAQQPAEFVEFELEHHRQVVLDAALCDGSEAAILEAYGLPAPRSTEL